MRDGAALAGYGVPLFLACTVTLRLLTVAVDRYAQFDLGFRFGYLSALALIVILVALIALRARRPRAARSANS